MTRSLSQTLCHLCLCGDFMTSKLPQRHIGHRLQEKSYQRAFKRRQPRVRNSITRSFFTQVSAIVPLPATPVTNEPTTLQRHAFPVTRPALIVIAASSPRLPSRCA